MNNQASRKTTGGRSASTRTRVIVLVLLVIALAIVASQDTLHAGLLRALTAIEQVIAEHPVAGAGLFLLLAVLSAMLAFLSSAVVVPAAVFVWGTTVTAVLLWVGWILGGVLAYAIGRYLGQPVVARLVSRKALERYQDKLSKRAPFGLVLLLQLAVPSEIPGYVLGLANYPLARFLLALAVAELPYVLATVFLGAGFLQRRMTLLVSVGAASILLSVLAWRALQRRLVASNASAGALGSHLRT